MCESHLNIEKIKNCFDPKFVFDLPYTSTNNICNTDKIVRLNGNKGKLLGGISAKKFNSQPISLVAI